MEPLNFTFVIPKEIQVTESIRQRKLGTQGLTVSAIGLGCMGMSEFYGPADRSTNQAVLHHALDRGVNFLDSADMYGVGQNEELLAEVLRERRSAVVLATKFGNVRAPDGAFLGINGRADYVAAACDASLRRLGVEHIDLYYQHRVDPQVPIEETVGAMARLVESGKVRYLGLCEASGATVHRAAKVHPIAALQTEYSLWSRDVEGDALRACRELGIGFVAYSPLGRGFLTGAFQRPEDLAEDDRRRHMPRFQGDNFAVNLHLVDAVTALAKTRAITPAQLALAWLLHQGDDVVPIPGTRSTARLDENVAATHIQLAPQDLAAIDEVLAGHTVLGTRYPAQGMVSLNR
jgi:aryl-alcohol dehydrogenase-like predicted oxidoreductase